MVNFYLSDCSSKTHVKNSKIQGGILLKNLSEY